MSQFFLQMSGIPGSGKTTIANAVAAHTSAVIIDHDVTKSALLAANVPVDLAGVGSYAVLGSLASHLLAQGHSVIHDSPCLYQNLLDRGLAFSAEFDVTYLYIECFVADLAEIDRRLRTRQRHPSQIASIYGEPTAGSGKKVLGEAVFQNWMDNMKRPESNYLMLDMSRPLAQCKADALAYLAANA
ncbi:MAG: AAA family ATPase [Chloroflexota bacterium]